MPRRTLPQKGQFKDKTDNLVRQNLQHTAIVRPLDTVVESTPIKSPNIIYPSQHFTLIPSIAENLSNKRKDSIAEEIDSSCPTAFTEQGLGEQANEQKEYGLEPGKINATMTIKPIQRMKKGPVKEMTPAEKRKAMKRRRMAGATVTTMVGSKEQNEENVKKQKQTLEKFDKCQKVLQWLLQQNWVQKQLKELDAVIKFNKSAVRGNTSRRKEKGPKIELGFEALASKEMAEITLRHELDHAVLLKDKRSLLLGSFEVYYEGRGSTGPDKGTFEYELEELLVRLRDWQRYRKEEIEFIEGYTQQDAKERIKKQYKALFKASDIEDYSSGEVEDVINKVKKIAQELKVDLE